MISRSRWSSFSTLSMRLTLSVTFHPNGIFSLFQFVLFDDLDLPILWRQCPLRIIHFEKMDAPVVAGACNAVGIVQEANRLYLDSACLMAMCQPCTIHDILL